VEIPRKLAQTHSNRFYEGEMYDDLETNGHINYKTSQTCLKPEQDKFLYSFGLLTTVRQLQKQHQVGTNLEGACYDLVSGTMPALAWRG
jgi:hypothetical protein